MTALQHPRRRPAWSGLRYFAGGATVIVAAVVAAAVVALALGGAVVVTAVSEVLVGR